MGILPHRNAVANIVDPLGFIPVNLRPGKSVWKGSDPSSPPASGDSPSVSSSASSDISREEMRKRGRAALVSTSPQGILGNAPVGRNTLV